MSKLIFYCEDDESINSLLQEALEASNYETEGFFEPLSMIKRLESRIPDLIILDLMLPNMSGYQVLNTLKDNEKLEDIPVIILSARSSEEDIVKGLDMGASDYMTKPFSINELIARIKANLRKISNYESKVLKVKDLSLDLKTYKFYYKDQEIKIRSKEFEILELLMSNPGSVVTRTEMFRKVWSFSCEIETRTIDVHIKTIRKKIEQYTNEEYIETVRGVGYIINK